MDEARWAITTGPILESILHFLNLSASSRVMFSFSANVFNADTLLDTTGGLKYGGEVKIMERKT